MTLESEIRTARGRVVQNLARAEIREHERHERRIRLAVWLGVLVPVACYLIAAYGVAALDALGLLP